MEVTKLLPRLGRDRSTIEAAKTRLLAPNELFRELNGEAMTRVSEKTAISSCTKWQ